MVLLLVWNTIWKLKLGYESTRKRSFMKLDLKNATNRAQFANQNGKGFADVIQNKNK